MDSTLSESDHNDGDEELCTSSVGSASVANSDLRGELFRLSASLLCRGKKPHYPEDPRFLFKPQKDSTTTQIFPGLAVLRQWRVGDRTMDIECRVEEKARDLDLSLCVKRSSLIVSPSG